MLEQVYICPKAIHRLRSGPLAPYVDEFAGLLLTKGYSRLGAGHRMRVIRFLNQWLIERKIGLGDLDHNELDDFIKHRQSQLTKGSHFAEPKTFKTLIGLLRSKGGVLLPPSRPITPVDREVARFEEYLEKNRGLAPRTFHSYGWCINQFLVKLFGDGEFDADRIQPDIVSEFVIATANKYCKDRAAMFVSSLRAYFRFLHFSGEMTIDLGKWVPGVARWRGDRLPSTLSANEIERLLGSCNRNTPAGKRDYAVLMLLSRTGILVNSCWGAGRTRRYLVFLRQPEGELAKSYAWTKPTSTLTPAS